MVSSEKERPLSVEEIKEIVRREVIRGNVTASLSKAKEVGNNNGDITFLLENAGYRRIKGSRSQSEMFVEGERVSFEAKALTSFPRFEEFTEAIKFPVGLNINYSANVAVLQERKIEIHRVSKDLGLRKIVDISPSPLTWSAKTVLESEGYSLFKNHSEGEYLKGVYTPPAKSEVFLTLKKKTEHRKDRDGKPMPIFSCRGNQTYRANLITSIDGRILEISEEGKVTSYEIGEKLEIKNHEYTVKAEDKDGDVGPDLPRIMGGIPEDKIRSLRTPSDKTEVLNKMRQGAYLNWLENRIKDTKVLPEELDLHGLLAPLDRSTLKYSGQEALEKLAERAAQI